MSEAIPIPLEQNVTTSDAKKSALDGTKLVKVYRADIFGKYDLKIIVTGTITAGTIPITTTEWNETSETPVVKETITAAGTYTITIDDIDNYVNIGGDATLEGDCRLVYMLKKKIVSSGGGEAFDNWSDVPTSDVGLITVNGVPATWDEDLNSYQPDQEIYLPIDNSVNNTQYNSSFLSNFYAGGMYVIDKKYDINITLTSIKFRPYANATTPQLYLYTVDDDDTITKYLGQYSIGSVQTNIIKNIPVSGVLDSGDRIAFTTTTDIAPLGNNNNNRGYGCYYSAGKVDKVFDIGTDFYLDLYPAQSISYISVGWDAYSDEINPLKKRVSNLSGKTISCIGDSMTSASGVYFDEVWGYLLCDRQNSIFAQYGIGGTEITNDKSEGKSFLNRYTDVSTDSDYIIVYGGTNDSIAPVAIGTESDSFAGGQETFYGALNDLIVGLQTNYPTSKIGFILPFNYTSTDTTLYVDALKNRLDYYSIAYFSNFSDGGINWDNSTQLARWSLDSSLHLNTTGHEFVSTKYEQFILSL